MSPIPQESAFDRAIDRYLQRQRSLGRGYVHEERVIDALRRFLKKSGCVDLDQAAFDAWCASQGHLAANTRRNRQRIVRNFCLNRQRAEPTCFVPDINRFPHRCPHASPVIFGPAEVARMLAMAERLAPTASSPLRPAVMRLAVVLLYTAGLRRGELLRLTLADVDPHHGFLRICESKFHKSRIVPLSPDASRAEGVPEEAAPTSLELLGGFSLALPRQGGCARLHGDRLTRRHPRAIPIGRSSQR